LTDPGYERTKILNGLKFNDDEPDVTSDLFHFREFSDNFQDFLLDEGTTTPYTIALHGEWGDGKTSLIRRVYDSLESRKNKESQKLKFKAIWFDAWQYEKLDPVGALLQIIGQKYDEKRKGLEDFKDAAKGVSFVFADIFLKTVTLGTSSLKDIDEIVTKYVKEPIIKIETIKSKLEQLVEGERLLIFIDDLDRCSIDNVLEMLEAIKMLLSAKGVIFVVAVDMSKLERAWELRYKSETGIKEGREHVDKIFQLKLSLPPKEKEEIANLIEIKASSLPSELRPLIVDGCPKNPRKIKRILNLIRYLVSTTKADVDFQKNFPVLVIWSILTVAYSELAAIIKEFPRSLIQMALILNYVEEFEDLHNFIDEFTNPKSGKHVAVAKNLIIPHNRIRHPDSQDQTREDIVVGYSTIKGLEYANKRRSVFNFLRIIAEIYSIKNKPNSNDLTIALTEDYGDLLKTLSSIIYRAGLVS
jgi:hypothetical protein